MFRSIQQFACLSLVSILCGLASSTASAAPRLPPERKDRANAAKTELDGDWKVVSISDAGKAVPEKEFTGLKFTFSKGKLELGVYPDATQKAWNPDYLQGASYQLNGQATPSSLDLKLDPRISKNLTVPGIYQIRKGQLKIAVRTMKTAEAARPNGYATVSGTLIAFTLKRDEPAAKQKQ